jgi:hypothetical protein
MAFLVYFFVLLAIATSVLFGLDWANAPLHPPASQERTQAAATDSRSKAAHQRAAPASAAVPLGWASPAPAQPRTKAETVGQQAATEPSNSASAEQRPVVAAQPSSQPASPEPAPQAQPQPQPQQPAASVAAAPPPAATPTPAPAANDTGSETKPVAATREPEKANAKAEPKPEPRRSARRSADRQRTARRDRRDRSAERIPDWALRGAEAARRDEERERRSGAPAWAYEGAAAARRDAGRNAQARESFRPFWESQGGWHFPW